MKNLLKTENILIIGGLAFITFWLMKKKKPTVIDVADNNKTKSDDDVKTIYLNLSNTKGKIPVLSSRVVKQYDSSKFATTSPARVTVNEPSNFYDL